MNGEQQVAAPRQRTRAEVQELVSEFVKRYAAERVLPQPRSELRNAGSPSEEAAVEVEDEKRSHCRSFGTCGIGYQEISSGARIGLRAGRSLVGRAPDRSAA
jgi:hypothetical protein